MKAIKVQLFGENPSVNVEGMNPERVNNSDVTLITTDGRGGSLQYTTVGIAFPASPTTDQVKRFVWEYLRPANNGQSEPYSIGSADTYKRSTAGVLLLINFKGAPGSNGLLDVEILKNSTTTLATFSKKKSDGINLGILVLPTAISASSLSLLPSQIVDLSDSIGISNQLSDLFIIDAIDGANALIRVSLSGVGDSKDTVKIHGVNSLTSRKYATWKTTSPTFTLTNTGGSEDCYEEKVIGLGDYVLEVPLKVSVVDA